MLQDFTSYDNLSERMGSFLLRNLVKSELDLLKGTVDINKVTDKDIIRVENPTILTKKPYTDYDCIILMMGDNTVKTSKKRRGSSGQSKTVYGLNFMIRSTYVSTGENNRYSGKEKIPSRRELLTDKNWTTNYDYFVIFKSKDLDEIRRNRQVKYGALIDPNSEEYDYNTQSRMSKRDIYNTNISKGNRDRYAKTIAEKSDYDEYFKIFLKLFEGIESKRIDAIKKHFEFYKENKTVKEYEFLRDFDFPYTDKAILKELEEYKINIWNKDRDGNISYDKFLKEFYKVFLDLLEDVTKNTSNNSEKLNLLKKLKIVLVKL